MTTVTGLTADRMLAIEAASVIDGDVDVNGNLILTKHDGSKINAGSVIGPQGNPGPPGSDVAVVSARQILDVGLPNQIRAGRQLSPADFAAIGLNPPSGLWNLSDLTDVSGNGRNLSNKGGVVFDTGINGLAATAARFSGMASQALYIPDTGAADPFRLRTGSWGCWFRTAKRATFGMLVDKYGLAGAQDYSLYVNTANQLQMGGSPDGNANTMQLAGTTDVADDRWHFGVATYDGTMMRVYVDGILDGQLPTGNISLNPGASPLNIGGRGADAATNALYPHWGRIDEAFVTPDVLSEDQVRYLYCAKLSHTLGAVPTRISIKVRRRRRGAALTVGDFATQPLRLYNFSAGSMGDEGSNGQALTNNGTAALAGADGSAANACMFYGASPTSLSSTDAGLPAGTNPRSWGCWFKTQGANAQTLLACGTTNQALIHLAAGGQISSLSGADQIVGPICSDGNWHFVVAVEYNAVGGPTDDGIKRKLYLDGAVVGVSTVLNALTLAGANRFRVGVQSDGVTTAFTGDIDGVFVCGYALTAAEVKALYAKSSQEMPPSPKNPGDHIEAVSATDIMAIFDTLESQHTIDLAAA